MDLIFILIPALAMIAGMYFLIIKPQKKREQILLNFQENIKIDDKVMTTAGIYGVVVEVEEKTVTLKMIDGNLIKFSKAAIIRKQTDA